MLADYQDDTSAARACITVADNLQATVNETARTEVTALSDEVNEAARIEACATGARILV
jgi:class 3 adenylate cyclase